MKILILFGLSFIGICCSNPVGNNSICSYEDVKLDTTGMVLEKSNLIETWTLQSFVDLTDCSVENEPQDFPAPVVVITFQDSGKVVGHTSNEFIGDYTVSNKEIELTIHSLTEINEPKWAMKFLEALKTTDYAFIEKSKLFIFYNQSSQVMVFTKN